jgi:hypothetical protein
MAYYFSLKLLCRQAAEMLEAEIEEHKHENALSAPNVVKSDKIVARVETSEEEEDEVEEEEEEVSTWVATSPKIIGEVTVRSMPSLVRVRGYRDLKHTSESDKNCDDDNEEDDDEGVCSPKVVNANVFTSTVSRTPVSRRPHTVAALTIQESKPGAISTSTKIRTSKQTLSTPASLACTSKSRSSEHSTPRFASSEVLGPFRWIGITAHVTLSVPPPPELLGRLAQFTSRMQPEPSDKDRCWATIGPHKCRHTHALPDEPQDTARVAERGADLLSDIEWRSTSAKDLGPFNWLGITVNVNLSAPPSPELLQRLKQFTSEMQQEPPDKDQGWKVTGLRKVGDTCRSRETGPRQEPRLSI